MNVVEKRAKLTVWERSDGLCETCLTERAVDWMHRLARSHGGLWCPSNGLAGCRRCHDGQRAPGAAESARRAGHVLITGQDPEKVPAWTARHGWVLLRPDGSLVPVGGRRQLVTL